MFVVCVTIFVKPESLSSFIVATFDNAANTRKEPANIRFDVLQSADDPTRFFLYEAYHTQEDFAKHQQTQHYLRWKNTVTEFMKEPRVGIKHHALFFGDAQV